MTVIEGVGNKVSAGEREMARLNVASPEGMAEKLANNYNFR